MKVLALNGSPRKRASTFHLLEALLAGMADAGAETELVQLGALDLQPCLGCFSCWVKTPGVCAQRDRDGMAGIIAKWREADLVVFGTPLYCFSMTGIMKNFLDRLVSEVEPWLVESPDRSGETTHPPRHARPQKALLVSPCGFPEASHFEALVHTFRFIARHHGWTWLGELLRPGAAPLAHANVNPQVASYLADVRRAGDALIREGHIPDALAATLARDLLPGGPAEFRERANRHFRELLSHAGPAASTADAALGLRLPQ